MGSTEGPGGQAALDVLAADRTLFGDERACSFGVTINPADVEKARIAQLVPGIQWPLDYDRAISTAYGATIATDGPSSSYAPRWVPLNHMLRVHSGAPLNAGAYIMQQLRELTSAPEATQTVPVLIPPGVLPSELCGQLVDTYERNGGTETGFMRQENGVAVAKIDPGRKQRADYPIED